jgi:hypothetical protein
MNFLTTSMNLQLPHVKSKRVCETLELLSKREMLYHPKTGRDIQSLWQIIGVARYGRAFSWVYQTTRGALSSCA